MLADVFLVSNDGWVRLVAGMRVLCVTVPHPIGNSIRDALRNTLGHSFSNTLSHSFINTVQHPIKHAFLNTV